MKKENIFIIGGQVKGESFIGRKRLLEKFRKELLESATPKAVSIVGLSRSGKTSFVKNVFDNSVPENVFYHYCDLSTCKSYYQIWSEIFFALADFIDNYDCDTDKQHYLNKLEDKVSKITQAVDSPDLNDDLQWTRFSENIKSVFKYINKLKIKTILIFDEFDRAKDLFILKTPQFALFRTIFSDGDMSVFAITISRRKIQTIEGGIALSSSLSGVMDVVHFKGFDQKDLEEYYGILKNKYGYECLKEDRDKILYYAGRLPFLLAIIGHNMVDMILSNEEGSEKSRKIDIDKIFKNKCKTINEYYDACIKSFENEKYLQKIISVVLGPNFGITRQDIDDFVNLGYIFSYYGSYVCISPYFTEYNLSAKLMELPIWDEIINTEKLLKNIIKVETQNIKKKSKISANSVNDLEIKIAKKVGIDDKSLRPSFIFIKKENSTLYKVMSIAITIRIIKGYWDEFFKKYFNNKLVTDFDLKFSKIIDARNGIAHGHEDECLTDSDRNEINNYCNEIIDMISKHLSNKKIPDEKDFLD